VITLPDDLVISHPSIVLVTGPSGSGKSQLIPLLANNIDADQFDIGGALQSNLPIIELSTAPPKRALKTLASVGLADAFSWVRCPAELSVGQRARLIIAIAIDSDARLIVIDEWLANLDRLTARAVAWSVGRALRKAGKSAIFVTAHDDLAHDLSPDLHIKVGWTPTPDIEVRRWSISESTVLGELTYARGDIKDWHALRHLHYAAGDPGTIHSIHALRHPDIDHPAAIAICSYPDLHSAARNIATDDRYRLKGAADSARKLNREVVKISRIVVTPELRGAGVASLLIESVKASISARYIECVTPLGRHSTFLARVGFREVPQTSGPAEAKLLDFAVRHRIPPSATIDADELPTWADSQSVRVGRELRRLAWLYYHHFVLHRRTRSAPPKRIPAATHPGWPECWDLVARRIHERPAYYICGPIDPVTGVTDDATHTRAGGWLDLA